MNIPDVAAIKADCKKAGKSFIYNPEAEHDEDQASFFFVGHNEGKEVVFDAFIYTLEQEFFANVFEGAEEQLITLNPDYAEADFSAENGPHIDALEEIVEELMADEDYKVQESVDTFEEEVENGDGITHLVSMDICLNRPEINDKVIEHFIANFNNDTLELDETFYSFEME